MEKIVKSIKKLEKKETVYDIEVDGAHHYVLKNGIISHNSGLKYCASNILFFGKRKEKEGSEVIGSIIPATLKKGRFTKENSKAFMNLRYETGLDRYYGLLEMGDNQNVFERSGNQYVFDGKKYYAKTIYNDPEKFFTEDVLKKLDEAAAKEYTYGKND